MKSLIQSAEVNDRDLRLIRREAYIRRERHVCVGMLSFSVFVIIIGSVVGHFGALPQSESAVESGFYTAIFFLIYLYICNLRIRHIESIIYYRLKLAHASKGNAD